ncbi:MAG: sugar ABC transporter substrate-binding protein [Anaerolineaceae bacterium]
MKKVVTILLTLTIVISVVACSGNQPAVENEAPAEETGVSTETLTESIIPSDLPKYKIALVYSTFTDKLGSQMKSAMEYLAEDFNVEFVFLETGYSADTVTVIESTLQTGIDGIIMVGVSPAVLDAAQKAGDVPVVMIQSEPTTPEQASEMAAYDNYLGAICENDYEVGYQALEALYNAGARNFAIAGLTKGLSKTHDDRAQAAIDFINSKSDATLLADDYSMGLWSDALTSFAASFPEMDGFFATGGSEGVYQVMRTEGLTGKVKYATIDIQESTGEYFQSGDLAWIAGGQYGTTMVGFTVLYNYLADGTRIIPDTTVTLYRPFLELNNYDEYEVYLKYVDGEIPVYTVEEVAQMVHKFNLDANFEYFQNLAETYSIEDIQTRHANLFD